MFAFIIGCLIGLLILMALIFLYKQPRQRTMTNKLFWKEVVCITFLITSVGFLIIVGLHSAIKNTPQREPNSTCLDGIEYWSYGDSTNLFVRIDPTTLQPRRCNKEL